MTFKKETKFLILLFLLFILASLLVGCAVKTETPAQDGRAYIQRKRDRKMDCIQRFLKFGVSPDSTKEICKYVFKKPSKKGAKQ